MEESGGSGGRWGRETGRAPAWAPWAPAGAAAAAPAGAPWCRVVQHPDAYTLQFGGGEPADLRQRLAALKGAVPPQRRRWDAATRTWWIDPVVERLFRALSHWTDRWFAPDQVQREHAAGPAGPAWACQRDTGDAAAVGWVEPPPAAPPGRAGPARPAAPLPGTAAGAAQSVNWQATPLPRAPARDALAAAYATLWLRPGAPAAVVKAAYRALAALHHPDTGGDVDAMRHLNAAYAVLQATTS